MDDNGWLGLIYWGGIVTHLVLVVSYAAYRAARNDQAFDQADSLFFLGIASLVWFISLPPIVGWMVMTEVGNRARIKALEAITKEYQEMQAVAEVDRALGER